MLGKDLHSVLVIETAKYTVSLGTKHQICSQYANRKSEQGIADSSRTSPKSFCDYVNQ